MAQGGRVYFHVYQKGFSRNHPASVERFTVREVSAQQQDVWRIESLAINGKELSDVQYGHVPPGLKQTVPPQPLKPGQLYVVELDALGGMEITYFVITPSDRPVTAVQSSN
jgi:hypothetical protein